MSRHQQRRRTRRIEDRRVSAKRAAVAGAGISLGATLVAGSAEAATLTVSNLNDSGAGSLRQALLDANANPGTDLVTFQSKLTGQITLASQLPQITDAVQILGPGADRLTISGNNSFEIFYFKPTVPNAPMTISGLTLTAARNAGGGAVYSKYSNLTVDHTVISNSIATMGNGGAIYASRSSLTVRSSTIVGNSAEGGNGGGGINMRSDKAHTLTIENSTISGNRAAFGGGIRFGDPFDVMQMHIVSSTISGNTATSATYGGGGIWGYGLNAAADTLTNTIVADNTAPARPDIRFYSPIGASFSLIENPDGATFTGGPNVIGQDPKLGTLGNNGGPTPTIPLLAGSPALDHGLSGSLTSDQRGAPRPFDLKGIGPAAGGDSADIGAYERSLCGKVLVNRVGTAGKDKLKGTKRADGILGLGGKDTLKGLAGNDGLCGGPGKDRLKGGKGNDRLFGQAGNDVLIGGKGRDKLKGGKGRDKQSQ
jgi:hemolysin type calcium-binding protein/parallel beta helix pectate lyase-like protein